MKNTIKPHLILLLLFINVNFLLANNAEKEDKALAPLQMKFFSKEISYTNHQYKIEINNDQTAQLNSITIGLPCGKITNLKNSENWPVRFDVLDKQSGIYGFQLINRNASRQAESVVISFEITALGDYCQNIFETWRPKLAYSYGGKIYQETLETAKSDLPVSVEFTSLNTTVNSETIEINTFNNESTQETIFDVISNKTEDICLEIYNTAGIKISTMFIGKIKEGIRNFITFQYNILGDNNYIYKLSSSSGELYGKIILPAH